MEKSYSILIAEDEKLVALDLKMVLINYGFKVHTVAETADELIELYKVIKPDLIISDINLKGEASGIDAIKEINRINGTPVIFLSGYGDELTKKEVNDVKPCEFLLKPFSQRELITTVNRCLSAVV